MIPARRSSAITPGILFVLFIQIQDFFLFSQRFIRKFYLEIPPRAPSVQYSTKANLLLQEFLLGTPSELLQSIPQRFIQEVLLWAPLWISFSKLQQDSLLHLFYEFIQIFFFQQFRWNCHKEFLQNFHLELLREFLQEINPVSLCVLEEFQKKLLENFKNIFLKDSRKELLEDSIWVLQRYHLWITPRNDICLFLQELVLGIRPGTPSLDYYRNTIWGFLQKSIWWFLQKSILGITLAILYGDSSKSFFFWGFL